jgi:hypothetical protein
MKPLENAVHLNLPEIPLDQFLPIFVFSALLLIFGLFFVAIYTLVKMELLKSRFMPFAYFFWSLQVYCLYFVADALGSDPFTIKVLMLAMVGYLILPHFWYYLNLRSEERYEH